MALISSGLKLAVYNLPDWLLQTTLIGQIKHMHFYADKRYVILLTVSGYMNVLMHTLMHMHHLQWQGDSAHQQKQRPTAPK